MILSGTGWSPAFEDTLNYAGQLAASVTNFFSGTSKEANDAQIALREQQQKAIADIQTEQVKLQTAKVTGYLDWQRMKTFFAQWWWVAAILIFIIFWRPVLRFFNIRTGYSRTRTKKRRITRLKTVSTPRKRKTVVKNPSGSSKVRTRSKSNFRRKLKGKIYTDPKAWSRAMLRLRGK